MQQEVSAKSDPHLSKVIKIDEAQIQNHLDRMVRSTVEKKIKGSGAFFVGQPRRK